MIVLLSGGTGGASPEELLAASPTVPAAELTTDDFHQVCRDTGQPSAVEFVAELPRGATGKVRKGRLRELA